MRNLKRALSMALASVMVLGLTVIGAGAASYEDFTDKDEIVHKDAVSMVTELGVLAGLPDGSFGGSQNIDRASFARLVCVVLNGGKEPVLGNLTTTFTDTQGNWAEKYISFCVDRGIIAGRGNNTFGPSDNVTGSEAAKMLLVALGYNTTYEGIGGATWEVTTNSLANMAGLYEELETINPSEPLSRDNAAQMIYNVLNANTVNYSFSFNADGSTTAVQEKLKTTMLQDKFGVVIVEGVVTGNEVSNLTGNQTAKDAGETTISVTNKGDGQDIFSNGNNTFKVSTGKDVLGRAVTLYVKPSATSASNASKATVLGTALVTSENNVVVDSGTKTYAKLASDNDLNLVTKEDDEDNATKIAVNYGKSTNLTNAVEDDNNTRGVKVTLIDNDGDDTVEYILTERYDFGKVSKYSEKDDGSITVTGPETVSKDDKADVVGFEDVAKGDYVLYAQIGGKLYVEKPETVEGTVTAYKNTSGTTSGTVTVDGTKYTASGLYSYTDSGKLADPNKISTFVSGVFYLDKEGYVVAIGDAAESSTAYALVLAADNANNGVDSARVKVALPDGTVATYTLDKCRNAANNDDATVTAKKLYTYTLSGDEISLREIASSNYKDTHYTAGTGVEFNKGKVTLTVNSTTNYYTNDNTVFFYAEKGTGEFYKDADVYVGKDNAPSIDMSSVKVLVVTGDDNVAKAVVVVDATAASNGDFLYLVEETGTVKDGHTYIAIVGNDVMVGETEIIVKGNSANLGLHQYSVNADGLYELDDMSNNTVVSGVISRDPSGKSIVLDAAGTTNDGEYTLNSDAVIAFIDGDDSYTEADLAKGDSVVIVYSDEREVDAVYILANEDDSAAEIVTTSLAAGSPENYKTTNGATVAETKGKIVVSSGASVVISASKPADLDSAKTATDTASALSNAGGAGTDGVYYIVVVSNDQTAYSVYSLKVE